MDPSSNLSARQQPPRREHGRVTDDADTLLDDDPFFPETSRTEPVLPKKVRTFTRKHKRQVVIGAIALAVIVLGVLVARLFGSGIPGVDSGRYQAVFLSDGTVYVGKLSAIDGSHYRLTTVYLVTSNQAAVTSDKSTANVSAATALSRLENGLLGAENEMTIQRDKVLFYENLKTDGAAAKLIADDQNK